MKKPAVRTPGTDPERNGQSDPDAAIAAAASGGTHKIERPKLAVSPSKVAGDPQRPMDAPVNTKREMPYEEAMASLSAETETKDLQAERVRLREDMATLGDEADEKPRKAEINARMGEIRVRIAALALVPKLRRAVLTEKGWVVPPGVVPPLAAKL